MAKFFNSMRLKRRNVLKGLALGLGTFMLHSYGHSNHSTADTSELPNILMFVADDMTWAHTSFAGCSYVKTPNFDRVAREGAYFENAFASSAVCTPTRGSLLTGLPPWQLGEGIHLLSTLPLEFVTYPEALAQLGYFSGFTGKGWGPGRWWGASKWKFWKQREPVRGQNPAGPTFTGAKLTEVPSKGMNDDDLPANFRQFLQQKPAKSPFCFWFGTPEPHVPYEYQRGLRAGMKPELVEVPGFLPDLPETRSDLLDYGFEIEQLDLQLGSCLNALEEIGELDNTLIVVVSDNGMPFPVAKHNCYEAGVHVPMAIRWGNKIPPGQRVSDLIDSTDIAATIYAAAKAKPPTPLTGTNLLPSLMRPPSGKYIPDRDHIIMAKERDNVSRKGNVGYPVRAIRTERYLYIRNYEPDRMPGGDAPEYKDVDPMPLKSLLIERQNDRDIRPFFERAFGRRPEHELFDVKADPDCLHNLARDPRHTDRVAQLRTVMEARLRADGDYRVLGQGHLYDRMPTRV